MSTPLNILLIEDSENDAELLARELRQGGYDPHLKRIESAEALRESLQQGPWDLVISDYDMPHFNGMEALAIHKELGLDIPFILVSGAATEDQAIEAMVQGAQDYIMKDRRARLLPAIKRELKAVHLRREKRETDVRLRQQAEELENFFTLALDLLAIADMNGNFRLLNSAWEKTLGYTCDELMQESFLNFIHPDDLDATVAIMQELLAQKEIQAFVNRYRYRDGTYRWIEWRARPVGSLIYAAARDITDRKKAEEERAMLEDQLHQAQKMESVGRLAGGIAHDFNNLLSPILGYTDMLMMGLDPADPRHRKLEQILKAAERSRDLIRQLLAFSRKQILALKPADLRKVVIGFESLLRHTLREDIKIDIKVPKLMATVHADEGQIEQVLMNLAVNAQDAMPGGGVLTLTLTEVEIDELFSCEHKDMKPGHYVLLTVSDTGHGMDKTTQELVFEPFFTTKEQGKGTGLGLSMVYGIIKQHGGHIWVYSEPDQGCTFKICLPVATESEQMPDSSATHPSGMSKGTETILLVEDNDAVRKMTCQALERYHYRVITAENGEQGLEYIKRHQEPIHLLLTDVVMPGINGRELYERLIAIRPEVKVLYMSGYTDDVIAHRGVLNAGVSFIPKPFSINALATKVRDVLDR